MLIIHKLCFIFAYVLHPYNYFELILVKMAIQCFRQFSLGVLFFMAQTIVAQQVIKLENPSFEDTPQAGRAPKGWNDCGFPDETPPDVQPNAQFQVSKVAQHGKTYLGLVVRDNGTWEYLTQSLSSPLLQGQLYKFSLNLCKSTLYVSKSKKTGKLANYTEKPVIVRVWGGDAPCARTMLLAETDPVENEDWQLYKFQFQPQATYHYITIAAFHKLPTILPYNGNVLIDNASDIIPILPPPPPSPVPSSKVVLLKKGKTFEIEDLRFNDGSDTIRPAAFETLEQLTRQLKGNPTAIIEIGGHTNGLPKPDYCDSLSLGRANSVRNYLIRKGIKPARLKAKGYGKRYPKAKDDTKEGRAKNQRVEIKVLN
jgi:outer membrane protein OmpA-like peptidoglycan-associated protein